MSALDLSSVNTKAAVSGPFDRYHMNVIQSNHKFNNSINLKSIKKEKRKIKILTIFKLEFV